MAQTPRQITRISHSRHRAMERLRAWCSLSFMVLVVSACAPDESPEDPLAARGEWTYINYWAQWCKPCIKEIPELNALHLQDGYRVLGVNYDGEVGEELQRQLDALGVAFPTLDTDPSQRFAVDRPQVLPTTLVIGPDGDLREVLIGPQTKETLLAIAKAKQPG